MYVEICTNTTEICVCVPFVHLQELVLCSPAAALLTVDAADGQGKNLLFQLHIWKNLRSE